ncbi:MAG TPA: lysophospholipase [bacterium]|nr:lysophospholipase [bacterium]
MDYPYGANMEMNVEMKFAKLGDGFECYYQRWLPDSPKALLIMIHGLGDHIGRYNELVSHLGCQGYACALYDRKGDRQSPGKRGQIRSFSSLLENLGHFISFVRVRMDPVLPTILIGGSLGGLIAINYIVEKRGHVDGLILASPAIEPIIKIPEWKKKIVRRLARILPSITVDNEFSFDDMTSDEDEKEYLMKDRFFHKRLSLGGAVEIESRLKYVMTMAHRIYVPTLILTGSADRICDPEGSKAFYERLAAVDKTIISYEGMLHDILHDTGRKRVMDDMASWLAAREGSWRKK